MAVFVGLHHSFGHYRAVAARLGLNLLKKREESKLVFVEALKDFADIYSNEEEEKSVSAHVWQRIEEALDKFKNG